MSSPRPSVVDAARAQRALRQQHHRGTQRRIHTRADSVPAAMASAQALPADTTAPRLPSVRPIDHRWDQSRGIILANAQRNVLRDFRWIPNDGIAFGDGTASDWQHSFSQSHTTSDARRLSKPQGLLNPQALPPRPSAAVSSGRKEERDAMQKELADRRKEAEELKQKLDHQKEELERIQQESRYQIQSLNHVRNREEFQHQAKMARLHQEERGLREREMALRTKEDSYDNTIATFKRETEAAAENDARARLATVEERALAKENDALTLMNSARRREADADAKVEEILQEQRTHLKRETQWDKRLIREYEEEELPAIRRSETDRRDYPSYRKLWAELSYSSVSLSAEYFPLIGALSAMVRRWRDNEKRLDFLTISPWFPGLKSRLRNFYQSRIEVTEEEIQTLKALRKQLNDHRSDPLRIFHDHRKSMRLTRFDTMASKYDIASTKGDETMHVFRQVLQESDSEVESLRSQLQNTISKSEQKVLEQKIKSQAAKSKTFRKVVDLSYRATRMTALKSLKQDSAVTKRIYLTTQPWRDTLDRALKVWDAYRKDPATDESDTKRSEGREAAEMQSATRNQIDEAEVFLRKQALLRQRLGKADGDQEELDATVDKLYTNEEEALFTASASTAGIGAFRRAPPIAIATPRIRASTSSGQDSASMSPAFRRPSMTTTTERPASSPEPQSSDPDHGRTIVSLERQGVNLLSRLSNPANYPSEEAKLADAREYQKHREDLYLLRLRQTEKSRKNLIQTSPGDTDRLKRIERAIASYKRTIEWGSKVEPLALIKSSLEQRGRSNRRSVRSVSRGVRLMPAHDLKISSSPLSKVPDSPSTNSMNFTASPTHQTIRPFWPTPARFSELDSLRMVTQQDRSFQDQLSSEPENNLQEPAVLSQAHNGTHFRSLGNANEPYRQSHVSFNSWPTLDNPGQPAGQPSSEACTSSEASQASVDSASEFQLSQSFDESKTPESQAVNDHLEEMTESGGAEPASELTYQISAEDFRNAAIASKSSSAAYWSHLLYKNSDGKTPRVLYCTDYDKTELRAKEFLNEPVLGFDIEWEIGAVPGKSKIKNNVSLIQIASEDKIGLFHIALFKGDGVNDLMPPSLRTILESGDVAKAGVNVQGDARRLKTCLKVDMKGLFELSHLYRVVMFSETDPSSVNRKLLRLADQVQNVLRLPLKKDEVRTSAWSRKLVSEQTNYAASDAYAGFRLYHALEAKRKQMEPMPPRPAFWEEHQPLQLGDGTVIRPSTKRKRGVIDGEDVGKVAVDDEEEDEEFFDAVETLDTYELDSSQEASQEASAASVPLSGILEVEYPSLPPPDTKQEQEHGLPEITADAEVLNAPVANTSTKVSTRGHPPPSPEVHAADAWVTTWRSSLPAEYNLTATPSTLRAYHLWHEQRLSASQVAALLREPPLSASTVASYVLGALNKEDILPFDADRVRTEMLAHLPKPVAKTRYWRVMERLEQA